MLVGLDLPLASEGTEAGVRSPQLSESEEKHLRLRVKQLICGSLNGIENQTVLSTTNILGRNMGLLEEAVAGRWSLEIVEQFQGDHCC